MIAQLYQPVRPIEVGNRQPLSTPLRTFVLRYASRRFSTFPSLVGSFESRLEVGNCHQVTLHPTAQRAISFRATPLLISTNTAVQPNSPSRAIWVASHRSPFLSAWRHAAPHRSASRLDIALLISTNIKLSSNRIRAVIGGLVLLCRDSSQGNYPLRAMPHLNSTNYATQRRRPSGRVRWADCLPRHCDSRHCAARLNTSSSASSQRIPCQAPAIFGWRAVRRNHVASRHYARLRSSLHCAVSLVNSPQRPPFGAASPNSACQGFGMPSSRDASQHHALRHHATHRPTTT